MATSNLRPIVSDDEKALWYIVPAGAGLSFTGKTFISGTPLLIGSTKSGSRVEILATDSSTQFDETFSYDGEVVEFIPSKNCSMVSIAAPESEGVTVSIVIREDSEPGSQVNQNNAYITSVTSTTALSNIGITGSAQVLVIGGGGGGGGSLNNTSYTNYGLSGGSGGGSGGLRAGFVTTIQNLTATIGSGGTAANSIVSSSNASRMAAPNGGTGGTTSIGDISATGGGGGVGPVFITNGGNNSPTQVNGGAGGTPNGAEGGKPGGRYGGTSPYFPTAGSVAKPDSGLFAYFSIGSGAGGIGGSYSYSYGSFGNASGAQPGGIGTVGSGGSSENSPSANYWTSTSIWPQTDATGYGSGGYGGAAVWNNYNYTGLSTGSAAGAGTQGVAYIFKLPE